MEDRIVGFESVPCSGCARTCDSHSAWAALGGAGTARWYSRGLGALIAAVSALASPDARVIVPAFICPEVVETVSGLGREVVLYPVDQSLQPEAEYLSRHLRPGDVCLDVRYFGMRRSTCVTELAKKASAYALEDTSQAPFSHEAAPELRPDLAFTSLRKYLPVLDGAGLDILNDDLVERIAQPTRRPSGRVLFSRWTALRMSWRYSRRPRRIYGALAQELFAVAARELRQSAPEARMSAWSWRQLTGFDIAGVRAARRANYLHLAHALQDLREVRVLWPDLAEGDCPYGCPVIVPNNRLWRDALNRRGVQAAILWDREDHWADFPASRWLADHLLVLPVTQGNTMEDMQQVARVVQEFQSA